ncbi:MAG: hypothetical protein KDK30_00535 [Leptospiraceae bacterium]|nr:hypothetical protein [Leptospiraceae bacterium]MCB1314623.1 hypothetical protein [Leptospiraceae bacterium]
MSIKKITALGLISFLSLSLAHCDAFGGEDDSDDDLLSAALLVAAASNTSSNNATFIITNNSGTSGVYSFHIAGSLCANTATGTSGTIASSGGTGTASIAANSSGYDIKAPDGNCSAVETGKTATTFTCTDPGGGGLTCS